MNKKTSYEMELDAELKLFEQFDGDMKAEFIKKYPEIWNDCYDIMEESRYHRVMINCLKAGAAFTLAYEKKRSAVLVEALEYFKQYDLDSIMRNKIDEALNSYEGGSND